MQSLLPVFGRSHRVSSSSWGQCLKGFHCSLLGAPLPSPECDDVTGPEPPARLCPQTAVGTSAGARAWPRRVPAPSLPRVALPIAAQPGSTRTTRPGACWAGASAVDTFRNSRGFLFGPGWVWI